jgi:hypothetical protein
MDVEEVINKIVKMRNKELDPIVFRRKLGIDPYTFRDEVTGEHIRLQEYSLNNIG